MTTSLPLKKALLLTAVAGMVSLASCGFGDGEPPQIIVAPTSTPVPTSTPTPTPGPTISPNMQETTYTSSDKVISIKMPDATWTVKADEKKMKSFDSPEQGTILILHGEGADDLNTILIPDTVDLALSLERASDLTEGVDFEIINYTTEEVGAVSVYSYIVHYMNTKKSNGALYTINQYFVTQDEYYSLVGTVKNEDSLAGIGKSMASFTVLKGAISAAATGDVIEDDLVDAMPATGESTAGGNAGAGGAALASGQDSGYYSEEALSDTNQTRTIYRNSDGAPIVVTPDGEGNWVDAYGNSYWYATDEDVYDQNDVDYYWHGEAGDVAFMPIGG